MTQWWLLAGLACCAAAGAWLAVVLLAYPVRDRGIADVLRIQGDVPAGALRLSAFAGEHLLAHLPPPRQFFEQLGPDRFRRELLRTLRARIDEHVDEVMASGSGKAWDNLSAYMRNAVYAHVRRRLPYAVDDFVERLQQELDELIEPAGLVQRHLRENPGFALRLFLAAFGRDLRRVLLPAMVPGLAGGLAVAWLAGPGWLPLASAVAAMLPALAMLWFLTRPRLPGGLWPLRAHGIVHRRREHYLRLLAHALADDAVAWPVTVGELLQEARLPRVRHIMRREVSAIFDAPLFRATLQVVLGPEGVAAVKNAAADKALAMLEGMHVSGALHEHYGAQLRASMQHAAHGVAPDDYARFWQDTLAMAWRRIPVLTALAGAAAGLAWMLLSPLAGG